MNVQSLIEYRVRAHRVNAAIMCAELIFAGQRFYAEVIFWNPGKEEQGRAVDLIIQTSHCLEQMLMIGLHGWLQMELESEPIGARETGDDARTL